MDKIIEPQKEVEVLRDVDVVVVGGGPAGIGAALAAGRNGAKTVLIEQFGSLGGLQTQGNNPIFTFVDPALHGGLRQEILARLKDGGALKNLDDVPQWEKDILKQRLIAAVGAERLPQRLVNTDVGYWGVWGLTFDLEYYKFLLENMMEEAGVEILYHAFAAGVVREKNSFKGVILESKEGRKA